MGLTDEEIADLIPAEHRDLIFRFFVVFSRFEYALKRCADFCSGNETKAEANWDKFAAKHDEPFNADKTKELHEAVAYFEENPPRKQVKVNGSLEWAEPKFRGQNEKQLLWLLLAVRRVRNNMFHGGKYPVEPIEDPERNPTLLEHALTILNACVDLNEEVRQYLPSEN